MATKLRTIRLLLVAAGASIVLAIVPAALAAKGGNGHGNSGSQAGDPSITISPAGPYSYGQAIYVTTNAPTYPDNQGPWIELMCYQDGRLVGSGDHAGFPGALGYNDPFTLLSLTWTGGAADCTVTAFHQNNNRLITDASTTFHVNP